jgi:tRNA (uracil-5-)-methyltransferase
MYSFFLHTHKHHTHKHDTHRDEIVGIVDPARAGLHPTVTKALRNCFELKRLVYISCNPTKVPIHLRKLLGKASKKFLHKPFKITKILPVDLFPHTPHCELVLLLER